MGGWAYACTRTSSWTLNSSPEADKTNSRGRSAALSGGEARCALASGVCQRRFGLCSMPAAPLCGCSVWVPLCGCLGAVKQPRRAVLGETRSSAVGALQRRAPQWYLWGAETDCSRCGSSWHWDASCHGNVGSGFNLDTIRGNTVAARLRTRSEVLQGSSRLPRGGMAQIWPVPCQLLSAGPRVPPKSFCAEA